MSAQTFKNYINGEWVAGAKTFENRNPANTDEVVGVFSKGTAQDMADAAREKHEIILEQLNDRLSDKAKVSVDRALEEERKDTTQNAKDKQDHNNRNPGGASPKTNDPSPRGSERTTSPRTATPRPTGRP